MTTNNATVREQINSFEGTDEICSQCQHRGEDPYTCTAFPNGIPCEILMGLWDHHVPYEGDLGTTFMLKEPEVIEVVKGIDISHVPRNAQGQWTRVGSAMGSNTGGVYEHEGKKHYVKFPRAEGQVKAEVASDRLHELMGVPTMRHEAKYFGDKLASVSQMQTVEPLGKKGWENMTDAQKQQAANAFVASAWTKNWDVVGLTYDNMGKTADGQIAIIDTGGSFSYRAMGQPKEFGGDASPEIAAMLSPEKTSGKVFAPLYKEHPEMFKAAAKRLDKISEGDIKTSISAMSDPKRALKTLLDRRQSIIDKLG